MVEQLVEPLADTWRWWASMGTFLAFWPSLSRFNKFVNNEPEPDELAVLARALLNLAMLSILLATFIMGAVIPAANDGRFEDFTSESALYKQSVALGWLLWGSGCWAIAIAFAERRMMMSAASVVWWWAMLVTTIKTVGAQL